MNSYKSNAENKNEKIPKGYRLKVSTHNKIKKLQMMTGSSQDRVISQAIKLYYKELINKYLLK